MKKQQKGFIVPLLIIIIAVLVVGGGVYVYQKDKQSTSSTTNTEVTTTETATTSTSQSTSPANENVGWKTYTNTTYNYTIKYPANWSVNTTYSNQGFTPRGPAPSTYMGGDTSITNYSDAYMESYHAKNGDLAQPSDYFAISFGFTKIDPKLSLEDYLKDPSFGQADKTENVTLNGVPGIRHTYLNITGIGGNTKPNSIGITLKRGNEIIGIGYGYNNSVKSLVPTAEKIIASFSLGASDKQSNETSSSSNANSPINVISPKLGDVISIGNYWRIQWVPTSTKVNVLLETFDQNGNQIGNFQYLAQAIDNTGEFGWMPSSTLSLTSKYKIKITKANDLGFNASDTGESGFFTLSSNPHY